MPEAQRLKVFLSYSRRDNSEFADELVGGLELAGFAPFLDRHDIAAGEDWEARLAGLIQEADTVVFIVSPEAVKSKRCAWEVGKTLDLSKRLLPIVHKPVADADIPEQLRRRQFVDFSKGASITRPLRELADALHRDVEWIREHTRLGELAARWQSRDRPDSLLLRGEDLDAAKMWVVKRKLEAPQITDLQRVFLGASEQAEIARVAESKAAQDRTRRTRVLIGVLAAILATVIVLGLSAYWSEQSLKAGYHWLTHVRSHVLTVQAERMLKPGDSFTECVKTRGNYSKYCPEMVVVPAAKFTMGSPVTEKGRRDNEGPQHNVAIVKDFAISRFEITFDEWDTCVALGACRMVEDHNWGRGKQPVIHVSWDDAQRYVKWLSQQTGKPYRLLSEAEWEYAARAGNDKAYSWGDEIGSGNANCGGCGSQWDHKQTAPVGSFAANQFGLHDMHGNLWEWVEDCWHANDYQGAPTDGTAWTASCSDQNYRVLRGGSWSDDPAALRAANRIRSGTGNSSQFVGFRVGRTLRRGMGCESKVVRWLRRDSVHACWLLCRRDRHPQSAGADEGQQQRDSHFGPYRS